MNLEEAKKLIGKRGEYMNIQGTITRVADISDEDEGQSVICEMDSGVVVNIDLVKILD
jgi:hypothetical protein